MAPIARTTALVIAVVFAAPVMAQVYKWVDEEGVTHYTQQPPPGGDAQVIDPSVGQVSISPPDTGGGEASASGDGSEEPADDADTQTVAEFCKQLRDEAQLLASDRPVKVRSGDTLTNLTGDARQQRLQQVQNQIQQHCTDEGA